MKARTAAALALAVFLSTSLAAMAQKSGAPPEAAWSMYGGVDDKTLPSSGAIKRPTQDFYQKHLEEQAARKQERIDGYQQQYEERIAAAAEKAEARRQAAAEAQGAPAAPAALTAAVQPVATAYYAAPPAATPAIGSEADRAQYYRPKLGYPYTED